jgi:uncharacterized OsmC-like protein
MNAAELRAVQAPLKQSYRDDPASARIAARAVGRIDQGRIACVIDSPHGSVTAGLHPAAGGDGALACSGDMLLEAMVACAGVTLAAVATAMGVTIKGGTITAEGVWDARGTLAIDRTAPVGVTEIALRFDLDTDADAATVERLIASTERYCVILQTLRNPPEIAVIRGGQG